MGSKHFYYQHIKLEFVFLQKHRCLSPFWCHIVLYIQSSNYRVDTFFCDGQSFKGNNSKSINARVMVLVLCTSFNVD